MEYLVKFNQKARILELKQRYFEDYCSDNQYAISIKEDTAYLCLHSPKTTKETRSNTLYPEGNTPYLSYMEIKYYGRYQHGPYSKKHAIRPNLVIQSTISESLENVVLAKSSSQPQFTYEAATSLTEFELKKILLDKMQKSKWYRAAQQHKELYDELVKSYKLDKDLFKSYGKAYSLKRDHEDKDKDDDPPARSDQGSSKGTKSQPNHLVSLRKQRNQCLRLQTKMPQNQGSDLGTTDDQPNVEAASKSTGQEYPFDLSKPVPLIEDRGRQVVPVNYLINNDLEYLKGGSSSRKYTTSKTKTKAAKYDDIHGIEDMVPSEDQKLYKLKEGNFPRLNLRDIKDMFLLLVQKKLSNLERYAIFDLGVILQMFTRRIVILKRVEDLQLRVESYQKKLNITKPETFKSDISNMTPYTAYNNPQGIIYQDKLKRNRIDYFPKRRWSKLDRKRSRIMIKVIDQQLFERRLMRNLEKFVGERAYGEDIRLVERTI
nr:hypothetical protein [Tanacetum cinerariifolium]